MMMNDPRQFAPATLRNRDFILGILRDVLPTNGVILEVASGSGEHVVYFARNFPSSRFPTFRSRAGRAAERRGMGEGHTRHECALAGGLGRLAITLADRFGRRDHLHQYGPHFTLGRDAGIDQGCGRDPSSDGAVLSLWPIQTRRIRNDPEQPSVRPKPSRSQPDLGSARPRSGRSDCAICRILGPDYHRDARKQSERGVPPDLIETVRWRAAGERPPLAAQILGHTRARSDRSVPCDSRRRLVQSRPRCS